NLNKQFPQPVWDGSDLKGKRILIHAEQGFGDTIQFSRYLPMVAEQGGEVVFAPQPELARLMRGFSGVSQLVTDGDPLPRFDVHSHLMSLPFILKTTLETIPTHQPLLRANQELIDGWKKRLVDESRLKVGIAWAGRPAHKEQRFRSITLDSLAP